MNQFHGLWRIRNTFATTRSGLHNVSAAYGDGMHVGAVYMYILALDPASYTCTHRLHSTYRYSGVSYCNASCMRHSTGLDGKQACWVMMEIFLAKDADCTCLAAMSRHQHMTFIWGGGYILASQKRGDNVTQVNAYCLLSTYMYSGVSDCFAITHEAFYRSQWKTNVWRHDGDIIPSSRCRLNLCHGYVSTSANANSYEMETYLNDIT